ncbi:MAG: DNA translocase FtsK [Solirubrobacteraceae bacterium]
MSTIDEEDFRVQVKTLAESSSADRTVSAGGQTLDWALTNLDPVRDLLNDPAGDRSYSEMAGSIERVPDVEPFATPGSGTTTWSTYDELAKQLELLARRAGVNATSAELVRAIMKARARLEPYLNSVLDEGVRLFIGAPNLRAVAEEIVDRSVHLWKSLDELRAALAEADRGYVLEIAEKLTSTDLRVVIHGSDVTAHVLPLHPIVLEPRVRAARLLAANSDLSSDFFNLVVASLDPAMPSLAVRFDGSSIALGYAGTRNGLLYYSRRPHQVDAVDVPQTIKQIVGRFISVHPYAELSLSLGLVSPPPRVAKALMRWLGDAQIRRARIDVYALPGDDDEIRAVLDDAMEEMISGEVENATARFDFSVTSINRLADLPAAIDNSEGPPHVLMFFDLAEVEQSGLGAAANSPMVGTLVSEWEFSTNPLEGSRPVIRPRSGSNELADLVNAQAGLFGSSVPSQERSPLLSEQAERLLAELADRATWIGTCEGMAAFVPAPRIGDLDLLGRIGGTSHVAFLYSQQASLLLEPILRYLQKSTWLHPDQQALADFLLGTVRRAVPEGLLGFFKSRGNLSNEAVLGRLGFAAVLAYLNAEKPGRLVVSLDTEGARRWLGLREGPEMRADLLAIELGDAHCEIEAIEIKSRTEPAQWGTKPPEWLAHAIGQVAEMDRLLRQMFADKDADELTPSRREILKRQVFLEALQQWEPMREADQGQYEMEIARLNRLFDRESSVSSTRRVFVVSTKSMDAVQTRQHGDPSTSITTLGVDWFKEALAGAPGSDVEIPIAMLDEFQDVLGDLADEANRAEDVPAPAMPSGAEPAAHVDGADAGVGDAGAGAPPQMARALRDALIARKVQFRAVEDDSIIVGPSVIQIPFSLRAGTRLATLQSQEADLARDLGVESVRIDNWPGRPGYAVAQLPRADRAFPDVDALSPPEGAEYPTVALGAQLTFEPLWVALDTLPHLLIGGTTGSGKSVFLRSLLRQLTHLYSADDLDLVVIDAKGMSDYLDFSAAPHIKQPRDFHLGIDGALELFAEVVEARLPARTEAFRSYATRALSADVPRHLTNLRELMVHARETDATSPLRPLVIVIDEFAELVLASTDRKRFETLVTRFNQTARAVGGHLITATQRPSTDVVSGLMKSNFARVALRTQQKVDSRVILDENGAEALLGRGDLLFRSPDSGIVRLQGFSAVGPYRYP